MDGHVLYSFRRCPYAMRARLALASAGLRVELREIVLRDKAEAFLKASPKGTVPVLVSGAGIVEESLEIMDWALGQSDPEGWLEMPSEGLALIEEFDGRFKQALDRYKYATRYADADTLAERGKASEHLARLEPMLAQTGWLFGSNASLADFAILPFVRQFANTDREWFNAQPWIHVRSWLERFEQSARFAQIMEKYPRWEPEHPPAYFPQG